MQVHDDLAAIHDLSLESDLFVWPPKTQADEPIHELDDADEHPRLKPISPNGFLESIETNLLGRTHLAFDRWASRAGWTREAVNKSCWRCSGSVGPHEVDGEGCSSCRTKKLPWDRAIRLGRYETDLRTHILALKFNTWRQTGKGLGHHLGLAIAQELDRAQIPPTQAVLIPIPMYRVRRIARGVDHTQVIAKSASETCGCRVQGVLSTRHRPEQVGLSATRRAQNIKGAFFIPKRTQRQVVRQMVDPRSPIRVWILVDDVRTTGATFVSASKTIRSAIKTFAKLIDPEDLKKIMRVELWVASLAVAGESRRGQGVGSDER